MDANVFGVVRVTQVFLPCMVAAGTGTSSTSSAGKWASMYQSPYNASKHALIGLTRCVALEIAKTGVVVTAVCPGFVDTPLLLESDLLDALGMKRQGLREMAESHAPIGRLTALGKWRSWCCTSPAPTLAPSPASRTRSAAGFSSSDARCRSPAPVPRPGGIRVGGARGNGLAAPDSGRVSVPSSDRSDHWPPDRW